MSRRLLALAVLALIAIFTIAACEQGGDAGDPGAHKVTAEEAVGMIEAGERTVIDVRSPAEFAEAHVAGAINIDVEGSDFDARIKELDADTPYLVYCRSGRRSEMAAARMEEAGIKDIADAGGLDELAGAGAPIE